MSSISAACHAVLTTADPRAKIMAARACARDWRLGRQTHAFDTPMPDRPARPALARNLPPTERPQRPVGPPRVMVISVGDPAIAQAAEGVIEEALESAGYQFAYPDLEPALRHLLARDSQ